MEEVLKIKITGDTSGLDASSARSIAVLDSLQASAGKVNNSIGSLSATLKAYGANAGVLSQSSKQIADGLKAIQTSAKGFSIKPISIQTDVDTSTILDKLNAATKAIKLNIDAPTVGTVKIPVQADTSGIKQQLADVTKPLTIPISTTLSGTSVESIRNSINALQGSKIQVPVQLGVYQGAIAKLKADLSKTKLQLPPISVPDIKNPLPRNFGDQLGQAGAAAKKNTKDFTALSQVLQDLPFGFIGIQNNITRLLPAAGGLGLALSAITTALTFASIGFGAWTRGMGSATDTIAENKRKLAEAKQALEDYVDSLDLVNKANIKGAQAAQEEIVALQNLYKATQNVNIPLSERKKLVDELQDQYPKYFANIKDEVILAGGAEKAYQKLSNAIIQAARARAAQDDIVEMQKQLLALEPKYTKALQNEYNALQRYNDAQKDIGLVTGGGTVNAPSIDNRGIIAQRAYNAAANETQELFKKIVDLQEKSKRLTDEIQTNIVDNGADVLIDANAKVDKVKVEKIKEVLKVRADEILLQPDKFTIANRDINFDALKEGEFKNIFDRVNKIKPIDIKPRINVAPDYKIPERVGTELTDNLNTMITTALQGIAVKSFSTLGDAIGQALTGGGIASAFASLGEFIGSAIQKLGEQMIALSPIMLAIQAAIKSFNPALLLPAGIALTALGGVIKSAFANSLPGLQEGGIIPSGFNGDTFFARLNSGEAVIPLDRLRNLIGDVGAAQPVVLTQRLRGRDLVLQQARENRSQRRGR